MPEPMFRESKDDSVERDSITLSASDARQVARLLARLVPKEMRTPALERLLLTDKPTQELRVGDNKFLFQDLQLLATEIFKDRRRRANFFDESMGEAAWDMLLALYINDTSGELMTVSRLVVFSNAPSTSALRWMKYLEEQQLVLRESHPNDARSYFIRMTGKARTAVEAYLSETLKRRA